MGVQYGTDLKTVKAAKEVISAGAVGSPAIWLRSGTGPGDILNSASVPTLVNLPSVGQHLQDHLVRLFLAFGHLGRPLTWRFDVYSGDCNWCDLPGQRRNGCRGVQ